MTFAAETRARALEVLGDTDAWTGWDWQRAAIQLASAVVAAAGDLDNVKRPDDLPPDALRPLPYDGEPVPTPRAEGYDSSPQPRCIDDLGGVCGECDDCADDRDPEQGHDPSKRFPEDVPR